MLLWSSLLILAAVSGQLGCHCLQHPDCVSATTRPQPVISLDPPWTTVFEGQTVILTCNGFHLYNTTKTIWYNGNNIETQGEFMENTFVARKSGKYKCQIQDSPHSDAVNLVFAKASVILQTPYSVFEGDTLVLRCQIQGKQKLVAAKYFHDGHELPNSNQGLDLIIPQASLNNSGHYKCHGYENQNTHFTSDYRIIKIQELFPHPELKVTDSEPIEGSPVLLSCETQLPLARWDTPLQFIFFRDDMIILSDWNRSSELQIPTIWIENSGLYGCSAETLTHSAYKHSSLLEIRVQRIPVSQVSIEIQPPGGQASEGEKLVLVCSVAEGTGETTFSWHRENTRKHVGQKTQRSQRAELEISNIRESHTGKYYCTADNGFGPVQSEVVNITVTGTPGKRNAFVAVGTCGGFFILLAVALLCYYWRWRKPGDDCEREDIRRPPSPCPRNSYHSIHSNPVEQQPEYSNVNPKEEDLEYTEVQIIQIEDNGNADTLKASLEDQGVSVIYSDVKMELPDPS